ncbi:hypothetical protein L53_02440 [Hyphomonas sp. L-53-1-40]|uniref:hypothetical protein n=1 Tax=Hyphomonas sp. L-53-1-40 TaxID=1207058 RepID=UPI000458A764|nr:hypothetical protein [Hyphomonas sp. L-53-1-40]KCZ66199.1 hypothetical protein L53_02440 [Hyphomonas sp. L-53-1-40]
MKAPILALAALIAVSGCALKKKEGYSVADGGENPDMVCERVPVPGKVYPGKICMTKEQWARHEAAGRDAASETQRRALSSPAPGGGG